MEPVKSKHYIAVCVSVTGRLGLCFGGDEAYLDEKSGTKIPLAQLGGFLAKNLVKERGA